MRIGLLGLLVVSGLGCSVKVDPAQGFFRCNVAGNDCTEGYQCRESVGQSGVGYCALPCIDGFKCSDDALCIEGYCLPAPSVGECTQHSECGNTERCVNLNGSNSCLASCNTLGQTTSLNGAQPICALAPSAQDGNNTQVFVPCGECNGGSCNFYRGGGQAANNVYCNMGGERCGDGANANTDGDSARVCEDADCGSEPLCTTGGGENCSDGQDNDGDSLCDCFDRDSCGTDSRCRDWFALAYSGGAPDPVAATGRALDLTFHNGKLAMAVALGGIVDVSTYEPNRCGFSTPAVVTPSGADNSDRPNLLSTPSDLLVAFDAFENGTSRQQIYLARVDGSGISEIVNSLSGIGQSGKDNSAPSVAFGSGQPSVAYLQNDGSSLTMQIVSPTDLDGPGSAPVAWNVASVSHAEAMPGRPSLMIDSSGRRVVAYVENANPDSHIRIESCPFPTGGCTSMSGLGPNDAVDVALFGGPTSMSVVYASPSGGTVIKKWNGSSLVTHGFTDEDDEIASTLGFAVPEVEPVVLSLDHTNFPGSTHVQRWNGSAWSGVGGGDTLAAQIAGNAPVITRTILETEETLTCIGWELAGQLYVRCRFSEE